MVKIGTIKAKRDTYLKASTESSETLNEKEKILINKGKHLDIKWIRDHIKTGHRKVTLLDPVYGRYDWFTFIEHWNVVEVDHPKMKDFPVKKGEGKSFIMPGLGKRFSHDPVDSCQYIKWYEITHNLTRIPNQYDIYDGLTPNQVSSNMVKIAQAADKIRSFYGKPLIINSGYRPPSVNRAVGGASQSRHQYGDALDIVVKGIPSHQVNAYLESFWFGGLASSSVFTHIDLRGYQSRWSYGY